MFPCDVTITHTHRHALLCCIWYLIHTSVEYVINQILEYLYFCTAFMNMHPTI